jgi:hypothetical protein
MDDRLLDDKQSFGILQQTGVILFENKDDMFAMLGQQLDDARSPVYPIGCGHIEGLGIAGQQPLDESLGCGHLIFACSDRFHIQGKGKGGSEQLGNHDTMIILDLLPLGRTNPPL